MLIFSLSSLLSFFSTQENHICSPDSLQGSLRHLSAGVCVWRVRVCVFTFSTVPLEFSFCSLLLNVRITAVIMEGSWGPREELIEGWLQRKSSTAGEQEGLVSEASLREQAGALCGGAARCTLAPVHGGPLSERKSALGNNVSL